MEAADTVNIALVAMSGIRVCDTELLRVGLTLPGFVERSRVIASLPSLGLLTLAGMTPRRHTVSYIEIPDIAQMGQLPTGFDLVAISSYSAQIDEAYELARRYKAAGIRTVIGGPHVSARPDEAAQHGDAVVVGEGETFWPQVLEDAEGGRLQPRYQEPHDTFEMIDAPVPAFELLDISKYNRLTVQTSRGCPHHCEFCAGSVVLTDRYKQKPIAKVLNEIERIQGIWERPFIEFADDNTFVDRAYWRELLPALRGKHLRWFAETDLSVADDARLLELMRETGCAQVLVGLESPAETGLPGLELRSDWKLRRFPRYKEAIRAIQSHGITVNGCFVLGLDGHTPDVFGQVMDFVRETGLYEVQITVQTPFPGTPLYERLEREGRLIEPTNWKTCTLFDINFRPLGMSVDELRQGFRKLAVELYNEEFINWRRDNFKKWLREHRLSGASRT